MSQATDNFIAKYKDAVIAASDKTGLFPSVTMAQMILESTWGKGITATKANNFFGVKADSSWKGKKLLFNTPGDAVKQNYFRVYDNPKDSIVDHNQFLLQNSRYSKAGVLTSASPEAQATALAKAGYAESKNYAKTLITLINAYNLKELDNKSKGVNGDVVALIFFLGIGFFLLKTHSN
jgi:flagellum-specific peptidoglycan hydrolase FlgJ